MSLEISSVCVVDAEGRIVREARVPSEPKALIAWFAAHGAPLARIGLEAGPPSHWLHAAMTEAGSAMELLETRHVRAAFKTMPVKTDKKGARGIAQLMRMGWVRSVHCKSPAAQEVRAMLTACKLLQGKLHDVEMSLRGILRGFGLKVGPTTLRTYAARVRALVEGHSTLEAIAAALLKARDVLADELRGFERRVRKMARDNEQARRLMTTPGVGAIVSLTYVSAIDEANRFRSSRMVGAHFGVTPKKYQLARRTIPAGSPRSATPVSGPRSMSAAHVILTPPVKGSDLKTWALGVAKHAGLRKAAVTLARKLAVVLHRMLRDQTDFAAHQAKPMMAA